jgi:hypothetical protein
MPDNYLDIIRQANEVNTIRQQPLTRRIDNVETIDWQLLASYLDSSIFQFILQNKHIPEVSAYGLQLDGASLQVITVIILIHTTSSSPKHLESLHIFRL